MSFGCSGAPKNPAHVNPPLQPGPEELTRRGVFVSAPVLVRWEVLDSSLGLRSPSFAFVPLLSRRSKECGPARASGPQVSAWQK